MTTASGVTKREEPQNLRGEPAPNHQLWDKEPEELIAMKANAQKAVNQRSNHPSDPLTLSTQEAAMRNPRTLLVFALQLILIVLFLQACGSHPARQLLSVTISPSSGTGQGSPSQVQFVATGKYNTEPYTVTPLTANWGVLTFPQGIATTSQLGLATCKHGSSGTTKIEAWVLIVPPVCELVDSAGRPGCDNVGASAQLTCP